MDFDSPDVEKEFPGLYSCTAKKDDDDCKRGLIYLSYLIILYFLLTIYNCS